MCVELTEKAGGFFELKAVPEEELKIIASLSRMKVLPMDMDQVRREKRDAALYPTDNGGRDGFFKPKHSKGRNIFTVWHQGIPTLFPHTPQGVVVVTKTYTTSSKTK